MSHDDRKTEKPLERYVRILEVAAGFPEGISPSALSEALDLPKATAHRLVRGLAEVQLLAPAAPGSTSYRIGRRLERLLVAGASDEWLKIAAGPVLRALATEAGQACFLARLVGDSVRSVEMVAPDNLVRAYIVPGQRIPDHAGASAKAILAYQDPALIAARLDRPLPRFTRATKVAFAALRDEMAAIREAGIAYCVEEDVEGFAAMAVPVLLDRQPVQHSLCLTGTLHTIMGDARTAHEARLRQAVADLARLLDEHFRQASAAEPPGVIPSPGPGRP